MKKIFWNISRPTHITHKVFKKNYAAIHEIKSVLTINKPCYVGFTWLSLQLYQKKIDADMLFTDVDSLTYEIVH